MAEISKITVFKTNEDERLPVTYDIKDRTARQMAEDAETVTKAYADEKDTETLEGAKAYADEKDAETLAEAKIYTNEKITNLLDKNYIQLELGSFGSTGETTTNSRARSEDVIPLTNETTICFEEGYEFTIYKTDDQGAYIGALVGSWTSDSFYIYEGDDCYVRIAIKKSDGSSLKSYTVEQLNSIVYLSSTDRKIPFVINKLGQSEKAAISQKAATDKINNVSVSTYVSPTGSDDTGDGTRENPFATFAKAMTTGTTSIVAAPGLYKERLKKDNKQSRKLKICADWDSISYTNEVPDRPKIVLDLGECLTVTAGNNGLLTSPYVAEEASYLYKVFISKTLDAITSSERGGQYSANIWEEYDGINDVKLVPVLTLEECQSVSGSFYYDGTTIYINPSSGAANATYVLCETPGHALYYLDELVIEDVRVTHGYNSSLNIERCNNVTLRNCEFDHSCTGNGLSMNYSNGTLYKCKSYKNRNDGFNFHGYGDTHAIDCSAYYNYDDGISHHDGCTGSVKGGEWHHNGKGGVASPTYGAKVNIYDAYIHHNGFGIYAVLGSGIDGIYECILSNCLITENSVGVLVSGYKLISNGNILKNNNLDKEENDDGSLYTFDA